MDRIYSDIAIIISFPRNIPEVLCMLVSLETGYHKLVENSKRLCVAPLKKLDQAWETSLGTSAWKPRQFPECSLALRKIPSSTIPTHNASRSR
jgi:hypothetical protein